MLRPPPQGLDRNQMAESAVSRELLYTSNSLMIMEIRGISITYPFGLSGNLFLPAWIALREHGFDPGTCQIAELLPDAPLPAPVFRYGLGSPRPAHG